MDDIYKQPDINITNDALQKGEIRDGKQLVAWDCIQNCNLETCPIRHTCVYITVEGEKCPLQVAYLQTLTDTIFSTYRYMNDEVAFKVGMHLIPLYSMLCRQKIVEKAVGELAYIDAKGVTRIHPIYKEIRETMKTILSTWKEIGFTPPVDTTVPIGGRPGFGDPTHNDRISMNSDNKRDLIR